MHNFLYRMRRRARGFQWDDGDNRWMWFLAVNSMLYISSAAYTPYLTMYYAEKGMTSFEIGILAAIGPIISICVQPLWAIFSDRTGRRKLTLSIVIAGTGLAVLCYRLGDSFLFFFLISMLVYSFSTSICPLSDALTLEYANEKHINFARIRIGGTLGYAVMALVIGGFLKQDPSISFLVAAGCYGVMFLVSLKVPIAGTSVKREKRKRQKGEKREKSRIFYDNTYVFVLIACFVMTIGLSFNTNFMSVYLGELGYDQNMVGIANAVSALSEVPILLLAGKLMQKFTPVQILCASCFFMALRLVLMTGETTFFIIASQLLQSVTYMTMYYSCVMFMSQNTYPDRRSQGQSIFTMVQAGFGSILGSLVGGSVAEMLDLQTAYRVMALFLCVIGLVVVAAYRIYTKKQRAAQTMAPPAA